MPSSPPAGFELDTAGASAPPATRTRTRGPTGAQRLARPITAEPLTYQGKPAGSAAPAKLPAGFTIDDAIDAKQREISSAQVEDAAARYDFAKQLEQQFPAQFPPPDEQGQRERLNYFGAGDYQPTIETGSKGSSFGGAFKSAFIADPGTRKREVAQSVFPGDPKGQERVGEINGATVYLDDDGQVKRLANRLTGAAASLAASSPEIVGAGIGGVTGSPVVGAGIGGALARGGKRVLSNLVFDEPITPGSVARESAVEGVVSAGGAALGKAVAKLAGAGRVVDYTPTPAQARAAEDVIRNVRQSTGINLDLAQGSSDRVLIGLRDFVSRYPGKSAKLIQQADDVNAGKLEQATRSYLDSVATAAPAELVGRNGVNTAQLLIRTAREKVSQKVQPLYEAAYRQVPEIKNRRFLAMLELPYFKQAVEQAKERALLKGIKYEGKPVDLRLADYTKQALDDQIAALRSKPETRAIAAALTERRSNFIKFLDNVSGDKYKVARAEYQKLAKGTLDPLENGVVGVLSRIKEPTVAKAAAKVLSDPNVSPQAISFARAQIEQQGPGAWDGMVRQWLGQKWAKANKPSQRGEVLNPAGKFYQEVFGETNRERTLAMLPPSARQSLEDLMLAMQKLAQTPLGASRGAAGSNTFRDTAIDAEIRQSVEGAKRFTEKPISSTLDFFFGKSDEAKQKIFERFTEAILDPAKRSQLKKITQLKPGTQQRILLGTLLATEGGSISAGTQDLLSPPPPVQKQ